VAPSVFDGTKVEFKGECYPIEGMLVECLIDF
jgi:hypothetical protein